MDVIKRKPDALCVWGDSIAKGVVWSPEHNRYVICHENCVRQLGKELDFPVINHAVMGCTVVDCLNNFCEDDLIPGGEAIIEFGSNDSDMPWADIAQDPSHEYPAKVPLGVFRESLRKLIVLVRGGGMTPVLITPMPLDGERYYHWVSKGLDEKAILQYLGDPNQMCRWQEQYANAVRDVSYEQNVELLDFRGEFLRDRTFRSLYCEDGIHPNAEGHKKLFEYARRVYESREYAC